MNKIEEGMQAVGEMHPVVPLTGTDQAEEKFNALNIFKNPDTGEEMIPKMPESKEPELIEEGVYGTVMLLVVATALIYTGVTTKNTKRKIKEIEKFYSSHNTDFIPLDKCRDELFEIDPIKLKSTGGKINGSILKSSTFEELSKYKGKKVTGNFNQNDSEYHELWFKDNLICAYILFKEIDQVEGYENEPEPEDVEILYSAYIGLRPEYRKYHEYQRAYILNAFIGDPQSSELIDNLYKKIKNGTIVEAAEDRINTLLKETGMTVDLFQEDGEEDYIFFEAREEESSGEKDAKIDEDIKPVVDTLNKKGYKTKYSCSGHPSMRVKDDVYDDGVKNGKLYSSARIVFDKVYNLPNVPKYWAKKIFDNNEGMGIYVKPPTFSTEKGMPKKQFNDWKAKYMYRLKQWVEQLPDASDVKEDENKHLTLEHVVDDFALDVLLSED